MALFHLILFGGSIALIYDHLQMMLGEFFLNSFFIHFSLINPHASIHNKNVCRSEFHFILCVQHKILRHTQISSNFNLMSNFFIPGSSDKPSPSLMMMSKIESKKIFFMSFNFNFFWFTGGRKLIFLQKLMKIRKLYFSKMCFIVKSSCVLINFDIMTAFNFRFTAEKNYSTSPL